MRLIFEWEEIKVYGKPIRPEDGETMRRAERRTAAEMAAELFGAGSRVVHDAAGAPVLENGEAEISISHGAGMLVMAVSTAGIRVGIDIELPREQLQRVARRFVGTGDSPELSLLELWTGKEAAFKAAGISELMILDIPIAGTPQSAVALLPDGRSLRLRYHSLADGALIALAADADGLRGGNKS